MVTALDESLKPVPTDSYAKIWQRAPFALAVVATQSAPPPPVSWASQYTLISWMEMDNQETVILTDVTGKKRMLVTREPNAEGIALIAFESNPDRKLAKAILRKNNEKGEVRFADAQKASAGGAGLPGHERGKPDGAPNPGNTGVGNAATGVGELPSVPVPAKQREYVPANFRGGTPPRPHPSGATNANAKPGR
ncbi:hypothetical protein DB346_09185 [Verrucomicrobia bacterium LW23]|nr:hypothetical protein DB346_09185 [Verrucomicrobia bacterium LW23]